MIIAHPGISRLRKTRAIWCFPRIPKILRIPRNPALFSRNPVIFSQIVRLFFGEWRLTTKFFEFLSCKIFLKVNFESKFLNVFFLVYYLLKGANFYGLIMQNLEISSEVLIYTDYTVRLHGI